MRGQAAPDPTPVEGTTLVLDEPIPEVEAELEAVDHDGHEAFLAAVRGMVHGIVPGEADDEPVAADLAEPAVPEEDLADWLPGLWVAEGAAPRSRRAPRPSRRERRREKAFAREIVRAARSAAVPSPEHVRPDDETLGEYLARVEAPRLPRRSRRSRPRTSRWFRTSFKVTLVGAVVAGSVALPWASPDVRDFLAGLVPGGDTTAFVEDPPVAPSTDVFVGPVGVSQQAGPYDGVRLEAAGPPREVVVERLHVDSEVLPISGQSGSLLPPSDPQVLGWWQEGKPAGAQYGTAVVTGHTVHTGGGALDHLDKLVVGDSVRVRTDNGWIRYVVQRTRIYPTDRLAADAEKIFRLGGSGRLVLITCDDWNGEFYESNAVVFAIPVADQPTVSDVETEVPDSETTVGEQDPSGNMDEQRGVVAAKMFDR